MWPSCGSKEKTLVLLTPKAPVLISPCTRANLYRVLHAVLNTLLTLAPLVVTTALRGGCYCINSVYKRGCSSGDLKGQSWWDGHVVED